MVLNILLVAKKMILLKPLCIILIQISGYVKYFEKGRKNMSSLITNDDAFMKYTENLNKAKKALNIKFHSMPVYDE